MTSHRGALQALVAVGGLGAAAGVARAADPIKQPKVDAATAARIPEAGRLLSYRADDDELVIVKLGRTGPIEVLRDATLPVQDAHWLDARTLVIMGQPDADSVVIRWVVDGKVDTQRTLTVQNSEWKLKKGQTFEDVQRFNAYLGPKAAIWLWTCVKRDPDAVGDGCKQAAWMRADAASRKTAFKKPKGVKPFGAQPSLKALPKLKAAPAGYKARTVKPKGETVKGIECTGPRGKTVWSGDTFSDNGGTFQTKKLQWVSTTPPLLAAEGVFSDPGGDKTDLRVFEACSGEPMQDFVWLGDGLWGRLADHERWTFFVDDQAVAIVDAGWTIEIAPP
jgi:hypothetical protein